jgi:two-component system KDP operon response regulator KdpE
MKVLVIEDDSEVVDFIRSAFTVGWPGTILLSTHQGQKGIEIMGRESVEAVILDLGLPDISGIEVLKQIRGFSDVPIIITTAMDSEADIVKGLGLGADEYITKPFGQMELLAKIMAVLRRQKVKEIADSIVCGQLRLDSSSTQLLYRNKSIHLTRTESLIMRSLMTKAGQLVSYDELAETVWGISYAEASKTLKVYVRRLRSKISEIAGDSINIQSKPGVGYLFVI